MANYEPHYYEYAGVGTGWDAFPRRNVIDYIREKGEYPLKILDVGCGTAEILSRLGQNISYTGIERSSYAVREARAKWKEDSRSIAFVARECPPLEFEDASFDGALLLFSLEHVRDPKGLLRECARVLKRGGFLIVLAPNLEFPLAWPTALRHKSFLYRAWFHIVRMRDYVLRLVGFSAFRVVKENFTDRTGRYERKDDDLRVLISSWEVMRFLKAQGLSLAEFWKERDVHGLRRFAQKLPALQWYGGTLAAAFRKS